MIFTDRDIKEALRYGSVEDICYRSPAWIKVYPIDNYDNAIQPASIDLRLGSSFAFFEKNVNGQIIDIRDKKARMGVYEDRDSILMMPGDFILGTTVETVELGPMIQASVEGKSSLGRIGLMVHVTAGFVDPGFRGQITLEMCNLAPYPIMLWSGEYICQIAFQLCKSCCLKPYGHKDRNSHYQDQIGATKARQ